MISPALLCCLGWVVMLAVLWLIILGLCAAAGRADDLAERRDGIRRS